MLNEAVNNNHVTSVENMLNEAPNSKDAMRVANNMRLTTMGAQKFSMVAIQLASCRKVDLPEMRDNDTKTIKVCVDGNKLCSGKEWRLYAWWFRR